MSMYLNAAETVFSVASVTSVTSDRTVCFVLGFCVCLILTHPHLQQLRYPVWPGSSRDTRTAPSRFFKLRDILDYNLLCRVSGDVFMLQFACLQRIRDICGSWSYA